MDIKKGQAIYTPLMLKVYNFWVLNISNQWIWRCHKKFQLEQFNNYISANHLDIGVGTGYYLQACKSSQLAKISLMDLNQNCLDSAAIALKFKGEDPSVHLADIFKTQPHLAEQFDSISMNYLLHCLPGAMEAKQICIANAAAMLRPQGILFGATILSDEKLQTKASRVLSEIYNKKAIFCNREDNLISLQTALEKYLSGVEIATIGCVALFKGTK
ncbi:MAG: class I SAM-dependent methyltransferase [Tatlockia sp.]|nr:class I SAM-dependent methyltransferase [Tatlockia sp.]